MSKFDWSKRDAPFSGIVAVEDEKQWTEKCNDILATRSQTESILERIREIPAESTCADVTIELAAPEAETSDGNIENVKRKASSTLIEQLTIPSKRVCNGKEIESKVMQYQVRTKECEIGKIWVL